MMNIAKEHAAVEVPVVLAPVDVEVPLGAVPVQIRDAAATREKRGVLPTRCHPRHCPSNTLRAVFHSGAQPPATA
jgi:hypothetical protein